MNLVVGINLVVLENRKLHLLVLVLNLLGLSVSSLLLLLTTSDHGGGEIESTFLN